MRDFSCQFKNSILVLSECKIEKVKYFHFDIGETSSQEITKIFYIMNTLIKLNLNMNIYSEPKIMFIKDIKHNISLA